MTAPPILLRLVLATTVTSGCTPPCEGAGCASNYTRADLHAFYGAGREPLTRSPLEADGEVAGAAPDGYDWALVGATGGVLVGVPAAAEVRWYPSAAFTEGTGAATTLTGAELESQFGAALAVIDAGSDAPTLLVGAPGHTPAGGPSAGGVFIYANQGPGLATVISPITEVVGVRAGDHFGAGVWACGDLDADGASDWAATAPWSSDGGVLAGSVTLGLSSAPLAPGEVSAATLFTLPGPSPSAQFGAALECATSLDGDPFAELVVGAPYAGEAGVEGAGSVSLWRGRPTLGRAAAPTWTLRGQAAGDYFGAAVAVGDLDGDGGDELVIGAPGADSRTGRGDDAAGTVYIFASSEVAPFLLAPKRQLLPLEAARVLRGEFARGRFGAALAIGDLDGDGVNDLVVGAPGTNPTGEDAAIRSGAATLWWGPSSAWAPERFASRADGEIVAARQYLETGAVVTAADLDTDGRADLVFLNRALAGPE